jgi:membrane protein implicated in regulation of membrane protease activity
MSGSSTVALFALIAMVILYAIEDSAPLATLGFAVACIVAGLSDFVLGNWPFGVVASAFALAAVWRWKSRRRQNGHA